MTKADELAAVKAAAADCVMRELLGIPARKPGEPFVQGPPAFAPRPAK